MIRWQYEEVELLHRVFLTSYNFRLRRRTVPRVKLSKKRKRKREKKWEGNELLVRDLSIDGSVCSLVERMYRLPWETFAVKPLPFACAFPQYPVPHSSRSSFSFFFFLSPSAPLHYSRITPVPFPLPFFATRFHTPLPDSTLPLIDFRLPS